MAKEYRIEVLDTLEKLKRLQEAWSELVGKSRANSVFLTWEWQYTWAEVFLGNDRTLLVVAVYEDDRLMAIAPWYVQHVDYGPIKIRRIGFIGFPEMSSDYLDVITRPGKEGESASVLFRYLVDSRQVKWDSFTFDCVPSNSFFFLNFINLFNDSGKFIEIAMGDFCPATSLPKTKEEFLASLRAHRRTQFNRDLRKLSQSGTFRFEAYTVTEGHEAVNVFINLYNKRWNAGIKLLYFFDKYIGRLGAGDKVEIEFICVDGNHVAGVLHLVYQNAKHSYLTYVDKSFDEKISLGNVMLGLCIQSAIEKGYRKYDFLKGEEPYKFHWANDGERLMKVTYYKKTIANAVTVINKTGKDIGKFIIR